MASRRPLVLVSGQVQQLQSGDDVAIPLDDEVAELKTKLNTLLTWMVLQGFKLPPELIEDL